MAETISRDESASRRAHMVDGQLRSCDVTDHRVLAAFLSLAREDFVPPSYASLAYLDRDLPSLGGSGRLLLAPMTLARLVQAANVVPGERALDVAGGSGYGAAVLASLGAHVVALESDAGASAAAKRLVATEKSIEFVVGDLKQPQIEGAFDVILVHGAFEQPPVDLLNRLSQGGRFVAVDASLGAPRGVLMEKDGGVISRRVLFNASAPVLSAFRQTQSFAF